MTVDLKGRDLLTLADWSAGEIEHVLDLAIDLKLQQRQGKRHDLLSGKTLGMIFQKSSTRTRVSFEVAMYQLGGYSLFLSSNDLQLGRGETVADTARVLSRYLDGIMIRTYAQRDVEELAAAAAVPVINGLTDQFHPCQVLADLLTIRETLGSLAGVTLAYVGDGNNMAHSLMLGGAKLGLQVRIASPAGYQPDPEIVQLARKQALQGGSITIGVDPQEAVQDAQVLYTDVWTSMGQEAEGEDRRQRFQGFQLNSQLLALAARDAIVMHCLPAHRGEEITGEVLDGPQSIVWEQAENRLHAQKAVLALLIA